MSYFSDDHTGELIDRRWKERLGRTAGGFGLRKRPGLLQAMWPGLPRRGRGVMPSAPKMPQPPQSRFPFRGVKS